MQRHVLAFAAATLMLGIAAGAQQTLAPEPAYRSGPHDAITDVPGVMVGHYTHAGTPRGTTAIVTGPTGGTCGVEVRGSNPGTLGDSTFAPVNIGEECDAIVFTGGSLFGFAAVSGVVDWLYERGRGVQTRGGIIPVVPAAVIFDLPLEQKVHPTREWGYKAADAARGGPVAQGNVGAGTGGTIGKTPTGRRMKGGLGTASVVLPDGVTVGALVVLNPLGDVVHPVTGELYARSGGFDTVPYRHGFLPQTPRPSGEPPRAPALENTTLVAVATDAKLTKTQLTKIAQMVHDGLARAIRPIHTMLDGDTVFTVSVGWDNRKALKVAYAGEEVDRIGTVAADVVVRAIIKGVEAAEGIPGFPSYREWLKTRGKVSNQAR